MNYEMNFNAKGFDKVERDADKVNLKLRQQLELKRAINRETMSSGGSGSGGGRSGGGSGRSARGSDPFERADRLKLDVILGAMGGMSQQDLKGAEYKALKADIAAQKAQQFLDLGGEKPAKTQQELIMEAIMTSRILPGGKLSPIVGKMVSAGLMGKEGLEDKMLGMGMSSGMAAKYAPMAAEIAGMALPVLIGAGATAAAVGLIYGAAEVSQGVLNKGNKLFYGTGGTPQEIGALMSLGIDAARANDIGNRLRQGGFGSAYMRQQGIVDLGPYTIDKAANAVAAVKALASEKNTARAIMVARDLGLEDQLWVRDLSPSHGEDLMNLRQNMGSEDSRKASAEYNYNKEKLSATWDNTVQGIGIPLLNAINTWVDTTSTVYKYSPLNALDWVVKQTMYGIGQIGGGDDSTDEKQKQSDTRDNTDAIKNLGRTLKDHAEMIGGGTRGAGSVPAGWKMQMWTQSMDNLAATFGAFGVG